MQPETSLLREKCRSIQLRFLKMYYQASAGHVGASLSCAEILTFVRFGWMGPEDSLILSKGHAAAALYSLLAEAGQLSEQSIQTFYQDGTFLAAHPPPNRLEGIPFATGSLGHGLSLSAGVALAEKLQGKNSQVFCVASDGELNEGSTWEALLFAAHHGLNRLRLLVDRNGLQGFGRTEDVMKLESLSDKFRAFGWDVYEADGHCFNSLTRVRQAVDLQGSQRPAAVLCQTVKGKGLGALENTVDCHYLPMTPDAYNQAVEHLLHSPKAGSRA